MSLATNLADNLATSLATSIAGDDGAVFGPFAATLSMSIDINPTLTETIALGASVGMSFGGTAALTNTKPLAATVALSTTAAATLNLVPEAMAASVGMTFGGTADLSTGSTLSAQLAAIYGANMICCLVADENATASQWSDGSGQGNHFTQSTPANRPTVNTGGPNSKKYLTFTGSSSQNQVCNSFAGLSAGEGVTVFHVIRRNSTSDTFFEVAKSGSGADSDSVVAAGLRFSGVHQYRTTFNSTQVTLNNGDANSAGDWHIGMMWVNTGSSLLSSDQDNSAATTTSIGATTLTNSAAIGVVGATNGLAAFYTGDIAAIIVCDVNDDTKRASAYTAIKNYYGF